MRLTADSGALLFVVSMTPLNSCSVPTTRPTIWQHHLLMVMQHPCSSDGE